MSLHFSGNVRNSEAPGGRESEAGMAGTRIYTAFLATHPLMPRRGENSAPDLSTALREHYLSSAIARVSMQVNVAHGLVE